jgi:uncharacterized protein
VTLSVVSVETPQGRESLTTSDALSGWSDTVIFVVKVASRCNLACTYCYMYQHVDQSWKSKPKFIARQTVELLAQRLREHSERITPRKIMVVAHGGEPLLYPDLGGFFAILQDTVGSSRLELAVQTNGTAFNESNLSILEKYRVHIGVSIDGNQTVHDAKRIKHDGTGTYRDVVDGIAFAKRMCPDLVNNVLQVIDPSVAPAEMLDALERLEVRQADLLLPDLNFNTFADSGLQRGEVGEWLCDVFDEWVIREQTVNIRFFHTIIDLLLGGGSGTDQLGAWSHGAVMIETDGTYEVYDALKTAKSGAGVTGLTLSAASIAQVDELDFVKAFRNKSAGACTECLRCPRFSICGGGSPIHRFSDQTGFNNPSVYCSDLMMLINHIDRFISNARDLLDPTEIA